MFHGKERRLSICVKAKFRCKFLMVIHPPLKFPWDPDSGLPQPGTAVPALDANAPDPRPPDSDGATSDGQPNDPRSGGEIRSGDPDDRNG